MYEDERHSSRPCQERTTAQPLSASKIRYIKLGQGGCWEAASLDAGRIDWGAPGDPHEEALAGDWDSVRQHYLDDGRKPATATRYVNEARAFYDGDESALWITFARGRMWWAFAKAKVHWIGGDGTDAGTRYRETNDGWHDCDLEGKILRIDRISTSISKIAAYRQAICNVREAEYCLRLIRAERDPLIERVERSRDELEDAVLSAIRRLAWSDFELLVELILVRSGWQRSTSLGGTMKDVDLVVERPFTGERMVVQVKSKVDASVVADVAERLSQYDKTATPLLACHSSDGLAAVARNVTTQLAVMDGDELACRTVDTGLIAWVLARII